MAILYQDQHLICDEDSVTILHYYFPVGSKRIAYHSIRQVTDEPMDLWTGTGRVWGMGFAPEWFHLDGDRHKKHRRIVINDGEWCKSVLTPDDHETVLSILREKTSGS